MQTLEKSCCIITGGCSVILLHQQTATKHQMQVIRLFYVSANHLISQLQQLFVHSHVGSSSFNFFPTELTRVLINDFVRT